MSRAHRASLWVAIAAAVAPLLVTRYLPFTDLPEHVAAMATLADFDAHAQTYELSFGRSQYLLYHCVGAILTRLLGNAIVANTVLLVVIGISTPLALRATLRAFERDERLAVFGAMPFLSRPLFVGFLPYVASIPLYFFGLALVARRERARSLSSTLALAAFGVALFYTHASAALLFVVTAVGLEIAFAVKRQERPRITGLARSLGWLLPTLVAAAVWWGTGRITIHADSLSADGEIGTMRMSHALIALPLWVFDVFVGHVDEACAVAWWVALGILTLLGPRRLDPANIPLFCAIAAYLIIPFRVGAGGMLNVRLAPIVALSAVLVIRAPRRATSIAALGVVAATVVYGANAAREIRTLAHRMDGFEELLASMHPHGKLVMLAGPDDRGVTHFHPYIFAGSYYRAHGGEVASYSFTELAHWPIHYRKDAAPPTHGPLWVYFPDQYDNAVDGPYYDYVLVQGELDPFASARGPAFAVAHRTPRFALYEKVASPTSAPPPSDASPRSSDSTR